ncbi:MAG: cyclic peptide export ABC transporter [Desulfobacteraceae bacterium]|nr:cyclic peptide export ABC transporter [Desulfobacteraceae bacterium]
MLKELLKPYSKELKKYFFLSACYVTMDVIALVIINTVFSKVLPNSPTQRYFILFIGVVLLLLTFYMRSQKNCVRLIETIVSDTREKIIEKVRNADLESFEKLGKSNIYNSLTLDTQIISEIIYMFMGATEMFFFITGLLIYSILVHPLTFLFIFSVLGFGSLIYAYRFIKIREWLMQARQKEAELFGSVSDLLYGFKELRVNDFKNDDFFHRNLKMKSAENRRYRIKAEQAFAASNVVSTVTENIVYIPILFILPVVGELSIHALFVSITVLLFLPFAFLKETIPYLFRAGVSVERVNQLEEELKKARVEEADTVPVKKISGFREIRYHRISFTYTDKYGTPLFSIKDISFSVRAGETLFIVGGNGSGKSTLLKVLTGLYSPLSGSIEVDGSEIEIAGHRYLFSVIFADFHLFDRLYGLTDINKEKMDKWLKIMQLSDKLELKGNQFSTLDLSTGQRKRLAMIATIMEDKPVYIFDEWAADQVPHFREFFYKELLPQFKAQGKTVIAVSHDDRYFHVADRVLKLEYGRLADNG